MTVLSSDAWTYPSQAANGELVEWEFVNGTSVRLRQGDISVDAVDPRLRLSNFSIAENGAAFPPEFAFHPETGQRLQKASTSIFASCYPSFQLSGQSVLPFASRLKISQKSRLDNVPQGAVAIFSCGASAHHFCICANGDLFFSAGYDRWFFLDKLPVPSQNLTTVGVVCFENGFATVLSNCGVVYQFIDGSAVAHKEIKQGRDALFCGPPSILENGLIVFPRASGDEFLLSFYDPRSRRWLDEIAADGPSISFGSGFPVSIQNGSAQPDIFWIGENGYLVLTTELGERYARTNQFPEGQSAVAGVPALRDEQGTIYVLTQTSEHYCYSSLLANCRTVVLNGPHLAAGRGRYIGRSFFPSLWSDESLALQIEAGTRNLLLPLAYSTTPKGATDSCLVVLVNNVDDIEALYSKASDHCFTGSLYLHSGAQLHALQITLRFRSRFEILMFLEDSALIVGSALTNDFYRLEQ